MRTVHEDFAIVLVGFVRYVNPATFIINVSFAFRVLHSVRAWVMGRKNGFWKGRGSKILWTLQQDFQVWRPMLIIGNVQRNSASDDAEIPSGLTFSCFEFQFAELLNVLFGVLLYFAVRLQVLFAITSHANRPWDGSQYDRRAKRCNPSNLFHFSASRT